MLSEKIYAQVERVVDHLAGLELGPEDSRWNYESLVETLKTLQTVYLKAKEDEFFYDGMTGEMKQE